MKRIGTYAAVILTAAAIGFSLYRFVLAPRTATENVAQEQSTPNRVPDTLPEFSLQDRDGQLRSIKSWPGKSMIINFWATWCGPCRKEIPLLMQLNKDKAAAGFQLVGVAVDFRDDVLKYANDMHIDYPLLIGDREGLKAVNLFGIEAVGFPFTVFTDAQGRIVALHLGEITQKEADVIMTAVERVNRGELSPLQARAKIAAEISG